MDSIRIHEHVQAHADAVVRGDMDAAASDFSKELQPLLPQLVAALPQPVTSAEVLSLDVGDPVSVATIRYSGDSSSATVRSHWEDQDGRPTIMRAEPAG